jgi:hypothetical protein
MVTIGDDAALSSRHAVAGTFACYPRENQKKKKVSRESKRSKLMRVAG